MQSKEFNDNIHDAWYATTTCRICQLPKSYERVQLLFTCLFSVDVSGNNIHHVHASVCCSWLPAWYSYATVHEEASTYFQFPHLLQFKWVCLAFIPHVSLQQLGQARDYLNETLRHSLIRWRTVLLAAKSLQGVKFSCSLSVRCVCCCLFECLG